MLEQKAESLDLNNNVFSPAGLNDPYEHGYCRYKCADLY